MTRQLPTDISYLLVFVTIGALAGFFGGRYYERRNTPRATVYINRFDCTKEGAEEARELKEEILKQQREGGTR
jgi:hypothetical protein